MGGIVNSIFGDGEKTTNVNTTSSPPTEEERR
jgi:hypothetical protein